MQKILKLLILLSFVSICGFSTDALAEKKRTTWWGWSKRHNDYTQMKQFNPYLENSREVQIPQWEHEDWYAEDWLSQRDGMDLVEGFYAADILHDQVKDKEDGMTTLLVGPNFYRLSGYDKRRVTHIVDIVYGVTASNEKGSFVLKDWNTRMPIGVFDQNGLRLH
jgi:hypothetical protein